MRDDAADADALETLMLANAREMRLTTYGDCRDKLGMPHIPPTYVALGRPLHILNARWLLSQRVLLAALVVNAQTRLPSRGFGRSAADLKVLSLSHTDKQRDLLAQEHQQLAFRLAQSRDVKA